MGIGRARVSQLSATRPDFWELIPRRGFIYTSARRELGGRACGGSEHRCVQGVRNSYVLHRTVYILIFYTCVYSGRSQVCVGRQKVSCLIPDGVYSDTLNVCIFWYCIVCIINHTSASDVFYCIWDMKLSTCVYFACIFCRSTHLPQMCFIAYGMATTSRLHKSQGLVW